MVVHRRRYGGTRWRIALVGAYSESSGWCVRAMGRAVNYARLFEMSGGVEMLGQ